MESNNAYIIKSNNVYGRYLIASKDIKAGDVIFKEKTLVIGPKMNSDIVCVNCHHALFKKFHVCSKCKLAPLCEAPCENRTGEHSAEECQLFSRIQNKLSMNQLISVFHIVTVLRCLLLRNSEDNKKWESLMNLEDHREKRKGTAIWELHDVTSKMIQNLDILSNEDLETDTIQKICGILDVNSFELRVANERWGMPGNVSVCGVYPIASLMAHNCVCNTHLAIDDSNTMILRASVSIQKDSPIFFNYTSALQGTVNRKEHLREGKYFECNCQRCSDATEYGTHMSSLKCSECTIGMVIMQNPTNASQYSSSDIWICSSCKHIYSGDNIHNILIEILKFEQNFDKNDLKKLEYFIFKVCQPLSDDHYIVIDAKQHLAGLLRDSLNRSMNVSKKMMKRKTELCKSFLPLLDILEPGISRLKAITLYEIYYPLVQLANREYEARDIASNVLLDHMDEAEKYLKDSIKILLYEPCQSPEGKLCKKAMEELRDLKRSIDGIKTMIAEEQKRKKIQKLK